MDRNTTHKVETRSLGPTQNKAPIKEINQNTPDFMYQFWYLILENLTLKRARHIFKQSLLCLQKILKHVWANKLLLPACSRIMIKHIKHYNKQNYHRVQTFVIIPVHLTFEEKLKCFHSNILLKLLSILLNVLAALTENKLLLQLKRL